jgi:hypothetical protein
VQHVFKRHKINQNKPDLESLDEEDDDDDVELSESDELDNDRSFRSCFRFFLLSSGEKRNIIHTYT